MKNKWFKRCACGLLAVLLTAICVPITALGLDADSDSTVQTGMSPFAEYFDESQLNPDYIEWLENGGDGTAPSAMDMSYLAGSYARMFSRRNGGLLPQKYDLREYGMMEPVTDQGDTGICWAISANSAAASSLMSQFPQMSFSPFHTAWFSYVGDEENEAMGIFDYAGAFYSGGNDGMSVGTMAAWKGPVLNDRVQMDAYNPQDLDESLRREADYHLQDAYYMSSNAIYSSEYDLNITNDVVKQVIMDVGVVTVNYHGSDYDCYNEETYSWYNTQAYTADHEVLIAGWDDNYPKENFAEGSQPEKDGAWLVRNSWGTDWGDDGYFWLSYEDKSIQFGNSYVLEDKDNYGYNYQYDILGWSYALAYSDDAENAKEAKIANIFTSDKEENEKLEAVSFYTTDACVEYTISVYTGVNKDEPESGTLQTVQTGTENYAGYHTIELNQPVKINAGESFSIVVTLKNPNIAAPVAVEWYVKTTPDDVPQYMGNGGESYVYEPEEGIWEDAAGSVSDDFYVTNVCIKGFTNILSDGEEAVSTVRFSEMEGPLADGQFIELAAADGSDIYYSIDGAPEQKYTDFLAMDFSETEEHTISAYAVNKDGYKSQTVEKTYTKAYAQLTDLAVRYSGGNKHFDTAEQNCSVSLPFAADSVQIMAQSNDSITVNGTPLKSAALSEKIFLEPGEVKEITVEVQGEGKNPTVYTIDVYRSMLKFNYEAETIIFDDTKYMVTDSDENELKNGDSVSYLISSEKETELTVTPLNGGESCSDYIPKRPVLTGVGIDYVNEQTDVSFSDNYAYSKNADMSDKVRCEYSEYEYFPVTPGENLYIQRQATETDFAGEIFCLEVPDRPAAPKVKAAEITENSVTLQEVEGALYSNGGEWQESPEFTGLTSGETYVFSIYLTATETAFCSEIGTAEIMTAIQTVVPPDGSFPTEQSEATEKPSEPTTTTEQPEEVSEATTTTEQAEKPSEATTPTKQPEDTSSISKSQETVQSGSDTKSPQTGDDRKIILWFSLMIASAGTIYVIRLLKRKNKSMKKQR